MLLKGSVIYLALPILWLSSSEDRWAKIDSYLSPTVWPSDTSGREVNEKALSLECCGSCVSLSAPMYGLFFFSIQAFHLPYPLQMFSGMQRKQDNNEREKQHSQSTIHRAEWLFPDMPAHWYHHAGWLNECSFHIFNFVCWESIQVVYIFNKDLGRFRLKLAIVHHLKIISFEW